MAEVEKLKEELKHGAHVMSQLLMMFEDVIHQPLCSMDESDRMIAMDVIMAMQFVDDHCGDGTA